MANKLNITWENMADRWAGAPLGDTAFLQAQVDAAVRFLLRKLPLLPQWVDSGKVGREDVIDVVFPAVARILRNPDGYERESEGNYSYGMNTLSASGNIWIPDADWKSLIPWSPPTPAATTRIRPTPGWAFPL